MARSTNPGIKGASDLYAQMLEVKNGTPGGNSDRQDRGNSAAG